MQNGARDLLERFLSEERSSLCVHGAITATRLKVLWAAFPDYSAIETLKLFSARVNPDAIELLFDSINEMPKLVRVTMNDMIAAGASWEVPSHGSGPRSLQSLEIHGDQDVDIALAEQFISRSAPQELLICDGPMLSLESHKRIAEAIGHQPSIQTLRLHHLSSEATLMVYFQCLHGRATLATLDIQNCLIGAVSFQALLQLMQSDARVHELALDYCTRVQDDREACDLAGLLSMPGLRALSLVGFTFRDNELLPMLEQLAHNSSLQRLRLMDATAGCAYLLPIGKALETNRALIELHLVCDPKDDALAPLVRALEVNRSLSHLRIAGNVDGPNRRRLRDLLERNLAIAKSVERCIQVGTRTLLAAWVPSELADEVADILRSDPERLRIAAKLSTANWTIHNAWTGGQATPALPRAEQQHPPDALDV